MRVYGDLAAAFVAISSPWAGRRTCAPRSMPAAVPLIGPARRFSGVPSTACQLKDPLAYAYAPEPWPHPGAARPAGRAGAVRALLDRPGLTAAAAAVRAELNGYCLSSRDPPRRALGADCGAAVPAHTDRRGARRHDRLSGREWAGRGARSASAARWWRGPTSARCRGFWNASGGRSGPPARPAVRRAVQPAARSRVGPDRDASRESAGRDPAGGRHIASQEGGEILVALQPVIARLLEEAFAAGSDTHAAAAADRWSQRDLATPVADPRADLRRLRRHAGRVHERCGLSPSSLHTGTR